MQDVFDEIKQEETLRDIENFFIDDNDIFPSVEISEADRYLLWTLLIELLLLLTQKGLSLIRRQHPLMKPTLTR